MPIVVDDGDAVLCAAARPADHGRGCEDLGRGRCRCTRRRRRRARADARQGPGASWSRPGAAVTQGPTSRHHRGHEDGAHSDRADRRHGGRDRGRQWARRSRKAPRSDGRSNARKDENVNRVMPLHLIKLCVGCDSVAGPRGLDQAEAQGEKKRGAEARAHPHHAHGAQARRRAHRRRLAVLGDQGPGDLPRAHSRRSARSPTRTASAAAGSCSTASGAGRAAAVPRVPGLALSRSQGCAARPLPRRARARHMPETMRRELRELGLLDSACIPKWRVADFTLARSICRRDATWRGLGWRCQIIATEHETSPRRC